MRSVKDNGGARHGAGRKSKAEELKLLEHGTKAIEKAYGSLDKYWLHIADKSKDSFAHLKLLTEYLFGKPTEVIEQTTTNINPEITEDEIKKIKKALDKKY